MSFFNDFANDTGRYFVSSSHASLQSASDTEASFKSGEKDFRGVCKDDASNGNGNSVIQSSTVSVGENHK